MADLCTTCGRAIVERERCMYCGGSAFEKPEPTLLTPRATEERVFRPGASLARLVGWSIMSGAAAGILWNSQRLLAASLLFVGPMGIVVYLLRFFLVRITVSPREGIVLRSGARIPWSDVETVEVRGIALQIDHSILHWLLHAIREVGTRVGSLGLLGISLIFVLALLGTLALLVAVLSGLLVPVVLLLSPWHRRVVVRLRDGREFVWRDLGREDEFARLAREARLIPS